MAAAATAAPPATPAGGGSSGGRRTSTPGLSAALSLAICTATRARAGYDGTRNAGVIAIGVQRALHARVGLLDAAPDAPNACAAGIIAAFAAACACGRRAWRHDSCWEAGGGTDWNFLEQVAYLTKDVYRPFGRQREGDPSAGADAAAPPPPPGRHPQAKRRGRGRGRGRSKLTRVRRVFGGRGGSALRVEGGGGWRRRDAPACRRGEGGAYAGHVGVRTAPLASVAAGEGTVKVLMIARGGGLRRVARRAAPTPLTAAPGADGHPFQ